MICFAHLYCCVRLSYYCSSLLPICPCLLLKLMCYSIILNFLCPTNKQVANHGIASPIIRNSLKLLHLKDSKNCTMIYLFVDWRQSHKFDNNYWVLKPKKADLPKRDETQEVKISLPNFSVANTEKAELINQIFIYEHTLIQRTTP